MSLENPTYSAPRAVCTAVSEKGKDPGLGEQANPWAHLLPLSSLPRVSNEGVLAPGEASLRAHPLGGRDGTVVGGHLAQARLRHQPR